MYAFTRKLQTRRRDARGQVLVLFALMLVVLLLASALAVDYGGWLVAKRNQQNVSDAAALAGAQQLTRPLTNTCVGGTSKAVCARRAAWQVIKSQLNLGSLDATVQGNSSTSQNAPYSENGWKVWVASPPSEAGSAYLGHVSGPGNVYVRIEHPGATYLSSIAGINRTVTAWSTAGRFPTNFAVIGMCSPTSVTANCLAGDANIKLDGTTTNLIVNTGDVGTNRWTKSGGSSSGVALGTDSNAYMQLFDSCWNAGGNQCNLFGYTSPTINTSDIRSAIPLGAPIQDPGYAAPTINSTTAPNQCRGTLSPIVLADADVLERTAPDAVDDLPIALAAVRQPIDPGAVISASPTLSGTVTDASTTNPLSGARVEITAAPSAADVGKFVLTDASGAYSLSPAGAAGDYTIKVSFLNYADGFLTMTGVGSNQNLKKQDVALSPNPGIIQGFVTLGGSGLAGVLVTASTGQTATSVAGTGGYVINNVPAGSRTVTATLAGYTATPSSATVTVPAGGTVSQNFTMAVTPTGTISGTVTDQVTTLPIKGATITLSTGATTTTNAAGAYSFSNVNAGSYTVSASVSVGGYMTGSPSSPASPASITVSGGANTPRDFALWPKGCGTANKDKGNWDCSLPSGSNCPATISPTGANVSCTFTQDNAIRPGTYQDIIINGCAWLDPTGGSTGLAAGQSAGIYYVTGKISLSNDSFLFGDGVTIVMKTGSRFDFNNGSGFVLNYGSQHSTLNDTSTACNFSTAFSYENSKAGYHPCFRTKPSTDTQDYAYAAWTTKGHSPWSSATFPTYNDGVVTKGQELGITFYLYGSGLGTASRFQVAGNGFGYLFNGVLYGPNDDLNIGGGSDSQTAAGQIVGWTIEYHGGTRIQQNWYGDPTDGQPFLVEPILGE